MDTFDDLLAPSRQALEDNPFADPFARRSGSPDPWANPFASTPLSTETFGHASSTAEPSLGVETVRPSNDEAPSLAEHHLSDPLDSAVHNQDDEDDNKPLGRLRSPGFRESVPSDFSEIATIRPAEPKESEQGPSTHPASSNGPSTPTPRAETPTWSPPQPTKDHTRQSSRSGSSLISPSSSTSGSSVTSPLEKSSITGLAHSVAALSLGGESLGGWQSEEQQTSWRQEPTSPIVVAPQVNDDDSDDDKPIRQTVKLPQEASPSVSAMTI
jgi:sorting nexin-1/2